MQPNDFCFSGNTISLSSLKSKLKVTIGVSNIILQDCFKSFEREMRTDKLGMRFDKGEMSLQRLLLTANNVGIRMSLSIKELTGISISNHNTLKYVYFSLNDLYICR